MLLFSAWIHLSALIVGIGAPFLVETWTAAAPSEPAPFSVSLLRPQESAGAPGQRTEASDPRATDRGRPDAASGAARSGSARVSLPAEDAASSTRDAARASDTDARPDPAEVADGPASLSRPDRRTDAPNPDEQPERERLERFAHVEAGTDQDNRDAAWIAKKTVHADTQTRARVTAPRFGTPGRTAESIPSRARPASEAPEIRRRADEAAARASIAATEPSPRDRPASGPDAPPEDGKDGSEARRSASETRAAEPKRTTADAAGRAAGGASDAGPEGRGAPPEGRDRTAGGEEATAAGTAAANASADARSAREAASGSRASATADASGARPAPAGLDPVRTPGPDWWHPTAVRVVPTSPATPSVAGAASGTDRVGATLGSGSIGAGGPRAAARAAPRPVRPRVSDDRQASRSPITAATGPDVPMGAEPIAMIAPVPASRADPSETRATPRRDAVDELQAALGLTPLDRASIPHPNPTEATLNSRYRPDGSNQTVIDDDSPFRDVVFLSARGTPFGAYMDDVGEILKQGWLEHDLPVEARARGIGGRVTVKFYVSRSGRVTDLVLSQSSGHPELDQMALAAVPKRLPPPGKQIPGGRKAIEYSFTYRNPIVVRTPR